MIGSDHLDADTIDLLSARVVALDIDLYTAANRVVHMVADVVEMDEVVVEVANGYGFRATVSVRWCV